MLCRSLEDNVENSAKDGGLACEISEGRLSTLIRDVAILIENILWFWLAGAEESAVINKIPELLK
jgi:F0F1-type ATP synthase beta subunit